MVTQDCRSLLLDVGGVLLADPLAGVFDRLAEVSSRDRHGLTDFYSAELRLGLWNGRLAEEEFWRLLLGYAGVPLDIDDWRSRLLQLMYRLPACDRLTELGRRFRLSILSNHRSEWLRPVLAMEAIDELFDNILISSETRLPKPQPAAFSHALDQLGDDPGSVLLIDDKESNLGVARSLGIRTLLANESGQWLASPDLGLDMG